MVQGFGAEATVPAGRMPRMAVTDLTGVSIEEWLTERPMLFALSSSVHSCGWMERGRSPYPQLKRWVRLCPSCSAICRCAVSQTSSMAAEAAASSQSACSISRALRTANQGIHLRAQGGSQQDTIGAAGQMAADVLTAQQLLQ